MVGSRGFEPRSARSERAASAYCATSRGGDHGRIRTATAQALDLSPLPLGLHGPLVPLGGLEPPPHGVRTRNAALTPQRELWFGLRVSNPSLHAGNVGCSFTPRPNMDRCPSPAHRLSVGCQRPRSFELVGGKGFEPNRSPAGERGYGPSADHPLRTAPLATAPGVEPGPTSFGGSDAPVTPRCLRQLTSRPSRRHTPSAWPAPSSRARGQNKKGLPGDRPRRPCPERVQSL